MVLKMRMAGRDKRALGAARVVAQEWDEAIDAEQYLLKGAQWENKNRKVKLDQITENLDILSKNLNLMLSRFGEIIKGF